MAMLSGRRRREVMNEVNAMTEPKITRYPRQPRRNAGVWHSFTNEQRDEEKTEKRHELLIAGYDLRMKIDRPPGRKTEPRAQQRGVVSKRARPRTQSDLSLRGKSS